VRPFPLKQGKPSVFTWLFSWLELALSSGVLVVTLEANKKVH